MLGLCAHLAALLPYARADEPLTVAHHAEAVVARRAADVLSSLKASVAQLPKEASQPVPVSCVTALVMLLLACGMQF